MKAMKTKYTTVTGDCLFKKASVAKRSEKKVWKAQMKNLMKGVDHVEISEKRSSNSDFQKNEFDGLVEETSERIVGNDLEKKIIVTGGEWDDSKPLTEQVNHFYAYICRVNARAIDAKRVASDKNGLGILEVTFSRLEDKQEVMGDLSLKRAKGWSGVYMRNAMSYGDRVLARNKERESKKNVVKQARKELLNATHSCTTREKQTNAVAGKVTYEERALTRKERESKHLENKIIITGGVWDDSKPLTEQVNHFFTYICRVNARAVVARQVASDRNGPGILEVTFSQLLDKQEVMEANSLQRAGEWSGVYMRNAMSYGDRVLARNKERESKKNVVKQARKELLNATHSCATREKQTNAVAGKVTTDLFRDIEPDLLPKQAGDLKNKMIMTGGVWDYSKPLKEQVNSFFVDICRVNVRAVDAQWLTSDRKRLGIVEVTFNRLQDKQEVMEDSSLQRALDSGVFLINALSCEDIDRARKERTSEKKKVKQYLRAARKELITATPSCATPEKQTPLESFLKSQLDDKSAAPSATNSPRKSKPLKVLYSSFFKLNGLAGGPLNDDLAHRVPQQENQYTSAKAAGATQANEPGYKRKKKNKKKQQTSAKAAGETQQYGESVKKKNKKQQTSAKAAGETQQYGESVKKKKKKQQTSAKAVEAGKDQNQDEEQDLSSSEDKDKVVVKVKVKIAELPPVDHYLATAQLYRTPAGAVIFQDKGRSRALVPSKGKGPKPKWGSECRDGYDE